MTTPETCGQCAYCDRPAAGNESDASGAVKISDCITEEWGINIEATIRHHGYPLSTGLPPKVVLCDRCFRDFLGAVYAISDKFGHRRRAIDSIKRPRPKEGKAQGARNEA